ncbi:MAG TPA: DUF3455 domain-containing protein [Burkholderiaceae bacterium]|nr:DUF3455 domain-containing protein [Burkholderiaceae bacterium]
MNTCFPSTVAFAATFFMLTGCAAPKVEPPKVASALQVPAGQTVALHTFATGVQIYTCNLRAEDKTRAEWTFTAPEATLFDAGGKQIGKHYAGPTWESKDGSLIVGALVARDDGPDNKSIPWLLLKAKSSSGNGVFTQTQSIQRVNTVGGKAPPAGCEPDMVGKEVRVPYTAHYFFYGPAR